MNTFSFTNVLGLGWQGAKNNFWSFLGFTLAVFAVTIGLTLVLVLFSWFPLLSNIIIFATRILGVFINVFFISVFLKIARREKINLKNMVDEFGDLFLAKNRQDPTRNNLSFVANTAIVLFFYGLMICFGLIFFIIPGIYLGIKYSQLAFLMVDKRKQLPDCKGLKFSEAIQKIYKEYREIFHEAGLLTNGIKWRLLLFSLLWFGLMIFSILPGILTLGFGFIFLGLVSQISYAGIYLELSKNKVLSANN